MSVTVDQQSAILAFRAAPGEDNRLEITYLDPTTHGVEAGTWQVTDLGGVHGGEGVERMTVGPGCRGDPSYRSGRGHVGRVLCVLRPDLPTTASVSLGDRDDWVFFGRGQPIATRLFGGPGRDELNAPGSDPDLVLFAPADAPRWLSTGRGPEPAPSATLFGGAGSDLLFGGPGNDLLMPGPGRDAADGGGGFNRFPVRDGDTDHVRCGSRRDRVRADGDDFVSGRRCRVDRRGAALGVLLLAGQQDDDESGFEVYVKLGCPIDSSSACRGTATIAVRGGRAVMRRRFRISPGRERWLTREIISEKTKRQLFRHHALARVRFFDADGRTRTASRLIDVYRLEPPH